MGWDETRQAIAKLFPVIERVAQMRFIVVVDAAVDSLGIVGETSLVDSTSIPTVDSVAPVAARAFRFAPPVEAGLYRIRVPFVVDSLIPVDMTDRCFPEAALTALATRALSYPPREEGWGVSFVSAGSRCADVVDGWASSEDARDLLASDASRHIEITITRVEMTWPETQWTFDVQGTEPRPRWIIDCVDETRCLVTGWSLNLASATTPRAGAIAAPAWPVPRRGAASRAG